MVSWMNTLPDQLQGLDNRSLLLELFHWLLPPVLTALRKHCRVSALQTQFSVEHLELSVLVNVITYTCILSCFTQEVVSTSNSNTVISLCRLFEMLLHEPIKRYPGDENIRTWIMVQGLINLSFLMILSFFLS